VLIKSEGLGRDGTLHIDLRCDAKTARSILIYIKIDAGIEEGRVSRIYRLGRHASRVAQRAGELEYITIRQAIRRRVEPKHRGYI